MRLYNTLGRKIETFKSITPGRVKFYSCGPTVYGDQTIGNLRTYVFYDTLKRTLQADGYKVKHVMNITNVGHLTSDADEGQDKIEAGAAKSGQSVWEIADRYTKKFQRDIKLLNILKPEVYRATDFIDDQIQIIKLLIDKDFAYQTDQAIYFDVSKLDDYGALTGQKLSEKETAARAGVITDSSKRAPQDFALWFFSVGRFQHHQMHWSSPWGEGFPGWHLECSAIVHAELIDPIDIHAGGVDLIGTHHTNEIAQTEAAFGQALANYWLHSEHLLVDGQRMAKSLKNFFTLDDVIQRGFQPLDLRLLYLQAHYRSQLNFTWKSLTAARNFLSKFRVWADLKFQPALGHKKTAAAKYSTSLAKIKKLMANDLDSPAALAVLAELVTRAEQEGVDIHRLQPLLNEVDNLFGLDLATRQDLSFEQKALIADREAARLKDDWTKADELRSRLRKQGVELNDTPHGTVWSRTDT